MWSTGVVTKKVCLAPFTVVMTPGQRGAVEATALAPRLTVHLLLRAVSPWGSWWLRESITVQGSFTPFYGWPPPSQACPCPHSWAETQGSKWTDLCLCSDESMSRPLNVQLLSWQSYPWGQNLINHRKWTVILSLLPDLVSDSKLAGTRERCSCWLFLATFGPSCTFSAPGCFHSSSSCVS